MRSLRLFSLIISAVFAAGVGLPAEKPGNTPPGGAASSASADDYVLQPSDAIKVVVFQEPDLEREVRITQEGSVSLPLIETVSLRNKTVRQAEELIRQAYDKDFLVNPQITVTVTEYSKRTVNVSGSVTKQGAISFPPEKKMTLVEAVSEAGPTRLANLKEVRLVRTLPDGSKKTHVIDVDKLLKGLADDEWLLQKDDVITVPERLL